MITPEEAKQIGLKGTTQWKVLVERIDSALCKAMALESKKDSANNIIDVDLLYLPLVIKEYSDDWEIKHCGYEGATDRLLFKPKESEPTNGNQDPAL